MTKKEYQSVAPLREKMSIEEALKIILEIAEDEIENMSSYSGTYRISECRKALYISKEFTEKYIKKNSFIL